MYFGENFEPFLYHLIELCVIARVCVGVGVSHLITTGRCAGHETL